MRYSPQRPQRLFWVVIHPNHLCALGGLGGEYFPRPAAHWTHRRPRTNYKHAEIAGVILQVISPNLFSAPSACSAVTCHRTCDTPYQH